MHIRRASRLAACFAISNMGLENYLNKETAIDCRHHWYDTPEGAVNDLAGHLMESDEHETIFGQEAESWFNQLKDLSIDEAKERFKWNIGRDWFDGILAVPEEKLEAMR